MRLLHGILCVFLVFATGARLCAETADLKDLQRQLAGAGQADAPDQAAIAEISRRILEIDARDQEVWEKRVRALLKLNDLESAGRTLDAWEHLGKSAPAAATNLEGDLAFARKDYDKALLFWNAALSGLPRREETCDSMARVYEIQNRWDKVDETLSNLINWKQAKHLLTRMAVFEDSAETHVQRARSRMELRRWDDALADIKKANKLDPTNEDVKKWLPQFEQFEKALPKIKEIDRKLAGKPQANPLLDQGLLFHAAQFYDNALQNANAALAVAPKSKRAILQKAQALIGLHSDDQIKEAAKLRVIVKSNNFPDAALQRIGDLDSQIEAKPGDAALFVARARECSGLEQYALALDDAQAAAHLDPKSADTIVEEGFATMKIGDSITARKEFMTATELDPKNAVAWRSLGELEMDRANYAAAIDYFSRSLDLHESPTVLKKRAECYRYSGHDKEAERDLQQWQKLTPPKK